MRGCNIETGQAEGMKEMTRTYRPTEIRARIVDGDRINVVITRLDGAAWETKPQSYTTVRNIDGSNRFMRDDGLWTFMPDEYEYAAGAASCALRGEQYPFPHCVPAEHRIVLA